MVLFAIRDASPEAAANSFALSIISLVVGVWLVELVDFEDVRPNQPKMVLAIVTPLETQDMIVVTMVMLMGGVPCREAPAPQEAAVEAFGGQPRPWPPR